MAPVELPEIDERRCTACGDCLAVCPTDCLEMWKNLPVVVLPRQCVSCGVCAAVCPCDAMELRLQPG